VCLLSYDRWTVSVLKWDNAKAHAIWQLFQHFPSMFSDNVDRNEVWQTMMEDRSLIWLGVYEGSVLVGVIYLDFAGSNGDVEVHLAFFDRKPAEKAPLCRALVPLIFQLFPRINRLSTTIPCVFTHTERLARKAGFTREGTKRAAVQIHGKSWDVYLYGLLRDEVMVR